MPGGDRPQAPDTSDLPATSERPPAETLPVDPDAGPPGSPRRGRRPLRERARHRQWDVLAAIAVGGGLGSSARYGLARAWPTPAGGFPWATFATNVSGSFALGLLMVYVLDVWPPSRYVRPFLGVGVIGGFTTFSTYVVEMRGLLAAGHWSLTDAYALSSLLAGLAAVWTGIVVARMASGLPVRRGPRRRGPAPVPGAPADSGGPGGSTDSSEGRTP
ncbi:fluoride efflux transporter FluC [Streptomyces sp. NPDC092296]|uniref:fluoride efflux transporter FluC n=1 Tax=Streptomyces sp. NPDC092296 TaxID=3366012 RepID=UPI00381ABE2D